MKNILPAMLISGCVPQFVITPKPCGTCLKKGGRVIVEYNNIEYIYNCPKLLPDHKPLSTYNMQTQLKYLETLDCKRIGSNPPWKHSNVDKKTGK